MQIRYHKNFEKHFRLLPEKLKQKTKFIIARFIQEPTHSSLRNHPLTGRLKGKRAISVTGNLRIIFEEYNNYVIVLMLDIGTHNQIY
ncbi:MAG: hypothetical protein A2V81_02930 [Candidatus Abawacabacteria bacterium RBG_16_42_10]|uniref:Plasmid stabilization protein n=1 Tax=Candidatus Abawacabacteria bacterium RBG_16_42_10 TaxID=1817814 RepID=A0A1F4XKD4_9BACT|nr:MAG: hypothetical protein A2V81_02930 [Candidatus Abawacabacteria bacterium RBG_16_42_10]